MSISALFKGLTRCSACGELYIKPLRENKHVCPYCGHNENNGEENKQNADRKTDSRE